jgi:hypothetical protein
VPNLDHLGVFIAAGLLLNLTPGPDVLYIVSHALRAGARAGNSPNHEEPPMPMTPQEALQRTIEHREIFHDEMLHLMRMIMKRRAVAGDDGRLITGLRVKKETIGEITAAAQVMREFSTKVHVADTTHLVDIVGTGGDGSHTFNISTCSMFVAAAAGRQGQQARRAQRQQQVGQRRCDGESGRQHQPVARAIAAASPRWASASCLRPTTTRP